jgi:hypothetical protein
MACLTRKAAMNRITGSAASPAEMFPALPDAGSNTGAPDACEMSLLMSPDMPSRRSRRPLVPGRLKNPIGSVRGLVLNVLETERLMTYRTKRTMIVDKLGL